MLENFRKTCQLQYKLDPAHYYSSPGMSWDALLKKTGIELELLTDYDQHLFIEKGMRGGISMVSKRYAKANNPSVEGCDPEKPNSFIMYLDANNLYGWAMSQYLPTHGFQWVNDCELLVETIAKHPTNSRVSRSTSDSTQCLSTCTREFGGPKRVDVKVPVRSSKC